MNQNNKADRISIEVTGADDPRKAFRDNRVDIIHELFPHLTGVEKYALATVLDREDIHRLGDVDYAAQFNQTRIGRAIGQYVGYLQGKNEWEQRKRDEPPRPVWMRRDRYPS